MSWLTFNDRLSSQVTNYGSSSLIAGIIDPSKSTPSISVEIIISIVSFIDNTPTLAACTSVNTTFHDLAIPLLYEKVVISNAEQLPLFLHGISTIRMDGHHNKKQGYLRHLTSLIIKEVPHKPFPLSDLPSKPDLFPSLWYIELEHSVLDWEPTIPLLQCMHHIQHVCFRNYKAGDFCPRDLGEVLKGWADVEYLTFYAWYAHYERNDAIRRGVPIAWKGLKEITIYPVLGHQGAILPAPTSRVVVPDPFLFMPDRLRFENLSGFTIMIPEYSHTIQEMYESYSRKFHDDQRALIRLVEGVRVGTDWA